MFRTRVCFAVALTFTLAACDAGTDVAGPDLPAAKVSELAGSGVNGTSTGGGHLLVSGFLDVEFSMSAVQTSPDGSATGRAHHSVEFQGELVEFHTQVTCVTFDEENGRAWIGGVITENNSTHPFWTSDRNEVGDDIWFRVVDYGEGETAAQPDRSTFVGFEGDAGIITSPEYCDVQPWPADDARTSPVTEGDIQVRVR